MTPLMNRWDPRRDLLVVTDDEVRRLCDFVYRQTGMMFAQDKRYYIDRRLAERMAATASPSFSAYFAALRANAENEIEHLINSFDSCQYVSGLSFSQTQDFLDKKVR